MKNTYTQSQLEKLKAAQLEMVREFAAICDRHGLQYFAVGGTCLGAVRHGGYIPWDDDIDLGMMREDYEQFLKYAPSELPEKFVLQHFLTDQNTPTYFAKIRNEKTIFLEEFAKDIPTSRGIFIDIFPFDAAPDNKLIFRLFSFRCLFLNEFYLTKMVSVICSNRPEESKAIYRIIRKSVSKISQIADREKLYIALDRCVRKYNDRGRKMIHHKGLAVSYVPYDSVFPLKNVPFENTVIPIPRDADYVLKTQYGDYMQLPPEEKRYSHKPYMLRFEDEM